VPHLPQPVRRTRAAAAATGGRGARACVHAYRQHPPRRWMRKHIPEGASAAGAVLGKDNFGFEVGAEFVHGPSTVRARPTTARTCARTHTHTAALVCACVRACVWQVLSSLLTEKGFKLRELFTWAHGDGGVSEHPAPDGGIGMYWLGKDKKLLRFDDRDDDLQHMIHTLWALGDRSEAATRSDPRSLLQVRHCGGGGRVRGHGWLCMVCRSV
jgi:hypothetical protein